MTIVTQNIVYLAMYVVRIKDNDYCDREHCVPYKYSVVVMNEPLWHAMHVYIMYNFKVD